MRGRSMALGRHRARCLMAILQWWKIRGQVELFAHGRTLWKTRTSTCFFAAIASRSFCRQNPGPAFLIPCLFVFCPHSFLWNWQPPRQLQKTPVRGLPGLGEGCGGVYLILNLSEKGSLVYLTVKNIRICNGLSEGRNRRGERKEGRVGNLRKWIAASFWPTLARSGSCTCNRIEMVGACGSCFVIWGLFWFFPGTFT